MKLKQNPIWLNCLISFLAAAGIVLLLVRSGVLHGETTLAIMDANIQYLDLFAWFKDIIAGNSHVLYTMSKDLGGNGIAVFAYYLSSPFMFLTLLFDKSQLNTCFDLMVALKLGCAAAAASFFLGKRFQNRISGLYAILLSVSYGLLIYGTAQSSNIMWLDGMYMLPIMLTGIYRLVREGRPYLLVISTALSMLFNWYSGLINCLFTVIFFLLELLLLLSDVRAEIEKMSAGQVFRCIVRYAVSMILGVCLSACLICPAILELSFSGRGSIDWNLFANGMASSFWQLLRNYQLGARSQEVGFCLYEGYLVFVGFVGFFASSRYRAGQKMSVAAACLLTVLSLCWQPLYAIFSLGKTVLSYWCRFSYTSELLLLFVAAAFFCGIDEEKRLTVKIAAPSILFAVFLAVAEKQKPLWGWHYLTLSIIFLWLVAALVSVRGVAVRRLGTGAGKCAAGRIHAVSALIAATVIVEICCGAYYNLKYYSSELSSGMNTYADSQEEQINALQTENSGFFRISQTSTRHMSEGHLTANYNESLAYDYTGIVSYTSDPNDRIRTMMSRLGYKKQGNNLMIVDDPLIAVDSLLSVRYILTEYPIRWLDRAEGVPEANGKTAYVNRYWLPAAFLCQQDAVDSVSDGDGGDGMDFSEYQEFLYSRLLGRKVKLYEDVYAETPERTDEKIVWKLHVPSGNKVIYGQLDDASDYTGTLDLGDGIKRTAGHRLSAAVFYIPTEEGESEKEITLTAGDKAIDISGWHFKALKLDELDTVTKELRKNAPEELSIRDGRVNVIVTADEDQALYTSIPIAKGWTIEVNDKKVQPDSFADCFYMIPLEEGKNTIVMYYRAPGVIAGCMITVAAAVILTAWEILRRRKKRDLK